MNSKIIVLLILGVCAYYGVHARSGNRDLAPRNEQPSSPKFPNQINNQISQYENAARQAEKIASEGLENAEEPMANESPVEIKAPIIDLVKDLNSKKDALARAKNDYAGIRQKYLSFGTTHQDQIATSLMGILFSIFILWGVKAWNTLRNVSQMLFGMAKLAITLTSWSAVIVAIVFNSNLWRDSGYALFWVPMVCMAIGAVGLRLWDFNFPLWRTLYSGLLQPSISGALISAKNLLPF